VQVIRGNAFVMRRSGGARLPNALKSLRTRHEDKTWASRIEAAAYSHTLALGRDIMVEQLSAEATPRLVLALLLPH
jgi:hypothetical protein